MPTPLTTNVLNLPVATSLDGTEWIPLVQGSSPNDVTKRAESGLVASLGLTANLPSSIEYVIDGAGGNILPQVWGYMTIPFDGNLNAAVMLANATGTVVMDVYKCTLAQFDPPTTPNAGNSISGGSPPTITASTKATINVSGWTRNFAEGDILAFVVTSATPGVTRVTLSLDLVRVVN